MASHIASFTKGDHICAFYHDLDDQISTVAPFIELGLEGNERCFCVLTEDQQDGLLSALKAAGIPPDAEIERGALVMQTPEQTYLPNGTFNPTLMTELLTVNVEESLELGFEGFRAAGDLSWATQNSSCCAQLPEYEALMERFYPERHALGLCLYDVRLFDADRLDELMALHRLALSAPDAAKRSIRIRDGKAFGDVIFDRTEPGVFHYTVQGNSSPSLLAAGQESSLNRAISTVKSVLSGR